LHALAEVPALKNRLLLNLALIIFLSPVLAKNGFTDEPLYSFPCVGRGGRFGVENPLVSFFPDRPKSEAREQLPDALENWVVEGECFPVDQGVPYATTIPLGASHSCGSPIPNLLTVMAHVEEVFHGFLTLMAKWASGGASEAPLKEVVPSEDAVLGREPKEKGDLGPEKRLPDPAPDWLGCLTWEIQKKVISFFDREST
jgi:hypothetical protein